MGPPKILIFGESGGASRLNADEVSSPCDLVTEREITGSWRVHKHILPNDFHNYIVADITVSCLACPVSHIMNI